MDGNSVANRDLLEKGFATVEKNNRQICRAQRQTRASLFLALPPLSATLSRGAFAKNYS
jgi:hypothetical protein